MIGTRTLALIAGCLAVGVLVAWRVGGHRFSRAHSSTASVAAAVPTAPASAPSSTLWVLSIGVSQHRDPGFNLQFAGRDATAIATTLEAQVAGTLYGDVRTLILVDDQVTRESILRGMEDFLGHAGADDVVVIFLAGHGVQEPQSGSYYFLPSSATVDTLVTAGLRVSDFDEMIRVVRRNARAVVLVLDTCHAGALRVSASGLLSPSDSSLRLSAGEGFFLLAAAKPGEDSKEQAALGHGAFTYALLRGLEGAADRDGDGLLPLSELFGYVAREVPRLTGGTQHPYHKMEGTDLTLAAVVGAGAQRAASAPPPTAGAGVVAAPAATPNVNTIGVGEFRDLRAAAGHEWIGRAVRVALNTELSKVRALRVYAPEMIDRNIAGTQANYLDAARRLGIRKLLTGSFHVVGTTVRIDAKIIDTATGVQEGSDSVQGDLDAFFELQKQLVLSMLRRLAVQVSPAEGQSIRETTNTSVDAYRLLLESEGLVEEPRVRRATPPSTAPAGPHSRWIGLVERVAAHISRHAHAAEPEPAISKEVHGVLEEYRGALQAKDVDRLAALYTAFSRRQRDALRVYLDNALELTVEVADIEIEEREDEIAVSYTRRDRFIDKVSAKPQVLEVRLTKVLVREDGRLKIGRGR